MFEDLPGPEAVATLARLDPSRIGGAGLLDAAAGWSRVLSWAHARRAEVLAEFSRSRPAPRTDGDARVRPPTMSEFAADEVAALLAVSRPAAGRLLEEAVVLATRLPRTHDALSRGDLDPARVRVITDGTAGLSDDACARVESAVLPRAATQTPARLRPCLARAVLRVDPSAARGRRARAAASRRVEVGVLPDETAELVVTGPAPQVQSLFTAVDAAARSGVSPDDPRGIDARRFDALIEMAAAVLADPGRRLATQQGQRPHIQVRVAATTLLGQDEEPAELDGYGTISAETARFVAADGQWRRILTDPVRRRVVEVGTRTYRPPQALVDLVLAEQSRCAFPTCRQPARRCDLDHVVPFPAGPTTAANLHPLCRHHHRMRHETGWEVDRDDGVTSWTSPTGHRYRDDPPDDHPDDTGPSVPVITAPDVTARDVTAPDVTARDAMAGAALRAGPPTSVAS